MQREFSGALTERVMVQLPVDTPDGSGGFTRAWQDGLEMWAQILPQALDERRYGGHVAALNRFVVLVRRDGAIRLDARLKWQGRLLSIVAVEDDPATKDRWRISTIEEREQ
jgi:SPP1 family predicted phage head-tail adaptor